jgi:hypothetical protein
MITTSQEKRVNVAVEEVAQIRKNYASNVALEAELH